LSRIKPEIAL